MDTSPSPDAPNPEPTGDDRRDDEDLRHQEEEAVDAVTAERLSDGVRRDAHGEYAPDPFPEEDDPGESSDDVIEHHRRQADRIEHQPDVPRADD